MWVWVAREDFEVTVVQEAAPTIMLAVGDTERERIVPKAKKFLLIREAEGSHSGVEQESRGLSILQNEAAGPAGRRAQGVTRGSAGDGERGAKPGALGRGSPRLHQIPGKGSERTRAGLRAGETERILVLEGTSPLRSRLPGGGPPGGRLSCECHQF